MQTAMCWDDWVVCRNFMVREEEGRALACRKGLRPSPPLTCLLEVTTIQAATCRADADHTLCVMI